MARKPPQQVAAPRMQADELPAADPQTVEVAIDRLRPRASKRTVRAEEPATLAQWIRNQAQQPVDLTA